MTSPKPVVIPNAGVPEVEQNRRSRIGDVIQPGQSIPDDVTGLRDRADDDWALSEVGHWHMVTNTERCIGDDPDGREFMRQFDPLTVTAVREPEPTAEPLFDGDPGPMCSCLGLNEWHPIGVQGCRCAALRKPEPLVLSLPQVPDGAVALQGGARWVRAENDAERWVLADIKGPRVLHTLSGVLEREGSVTVVMREPRTWPRLDGAEPGMKVRGASGNVYRFGPDSPTTGCMAFVDRIGDVLYGCRMTLGTLREFDGPLTEVFDDGGEPA